MDTAEPQIANQKSQIKNDLIPREVLHGNPDRTTVTISPDGRRIAFLAPVKGVLNVWVGPSDHPDAAEAVTRDTGRGIRMYLWSHTNRHILYLQDKDGDENWRLYCVELESRETKDLTPFEGVQARPYRASHKRPEEMVVGLNNRDARFHDLYRVNSVTGERNQLLENNEFAGFEIDDDLAIRFAERMTTDGGFEVFRYSEDGKWEPFATVDQEDSLTTGLAGFDKSGDVLYMRDSRERDTSALFAVDLKTGKRTPIAEDERSDVRSVMRHPTEKNVQAVSFNYEREFRQYFDEAVKKDFERLGQVCKGEVHVSSRTLDDRQWVVSFVADDGPVRYYLYDRKTKDARFLFVNRSDLEGLPLTRQHPVVVTSRDGMDMVCYLSLPPWTDPRATGRPERPLPMVLFVHGGPWGRDAWGFNATHQWLANRGYAVLSVNYRGSTGFGKRFVNAGDKQWAAAMHDDLIDAVDWAVAEKIADADKVAIMGGSYGGYATLAGLTFTPEKFACGVDIVGPSNLVTLLKSIPPYWTPMLNMFKARVGDPDNEEGRKLLESRSPLTFADRIRRPLLIGQGANDPRVKRAESDQIVQAMREKGIPVTYVLFQDEGHGFARPVNRLYFDAVTETFLAQYLGGRYEPLGPELQDASLTVKIG